MKFGSWTNEDWVRHYAGPRWSGRAEPGSAWDTQGRRIPGEMVRYGHETRVMTTGDVFDAKSALDARYGKLADEMAACNMLDAAEREAFDAHVAAWRAFFCGGIPDGRREPHVEVVGLAAQMNAVDRFEHHLHVWHERLAEHYASGDTEQERIEKRRRPALILAAIAGAVYFFGPPLRRELFSPVMIHKDLVERRRQMARDMGEPDVALDSGKGLGADLAAKVGDVLNLTGRGGRGFEPSEPKALPPHVESSAPAEPESAEPEVETESESEPVENSEE